MCTALTFKTNDSYFGRNLDLEYAYSESVTIAPRNYPFDFRKKESLMHHYAMIGIATVSDNYPLYYDAVNEHGLAMAGLNFPGNAVYYPEKYEKDNITPFELTPWLLGQCRNIEEVEILLNKINLLNLPFSQAFPLSPLHWLIADREKSITLESSEKGICIHRNPVGVLTNNPPFEYHLHNLCNYMNLTAQEPTNRFSKNIKLDPYSRGMGAIGLPGDLSSASRFIRAAFTKLNSFCADDEMSSVGQFFHILDAVSQTEGCVKIGDKFEKTIYSCCCNQNSGIYYYKTYSNNQITAVNLFTENLHGENLISYPLLQRQNIHYVN